MTIAIIDARGSKPVVAGSEAVANALSRITTLETSVSALAIGSGTQAHSAKLDAIAGLTLAADRMIYWTGASAAAVTPITSYGRTVVGLANAAALKSNLSISNISDTSVTTTGNITAGGDVYANGGNVFIGSTLELAANGAGGYNIRLKVGGTMTTIGTIDTSGNMALTGSFYDNATSPSAATGSRLYGPNNPPEYISNVPYDEAIWTADQWQQTQDRPADLERVTLTTTKTYNVSAGDLGRVIYVNVAGANIDFGFLYDGQEITVFNVNATAANGYAGNDLTGWLGQGSDKTAKLPQGLTRVVRCGNYVSAHSNGSITYDTTAAEVRDLTLVTAGQSNSVYLFDQGGLAGLQGRWAELGNTESFWAVTGGLGSSALLKDNSASNYWWDQDLAAAGPRLDDLISAIEAIPTSQPAPDVIIWDQGEADRSGLANATITAAEYEAALQDVFDYIRGYSFTRASTVLTTIPIVIIPLGADDTASVDERAYVAIREAQHAVADADANTHIGPEKYDLPRKYTDVHLTFKGTVAEGERLADFLDNLLNAATNDIGPEITGVSFSGNDMILTIESDVGMVRPDSGADPIGIPIGIKARTTGDVMAATFVTPESYAWSGSATVATLTCDMGVDVSSGYQLAFPVGSLSQIRRGRYIRQRGVAGLPLRSYGP